MGSSFLRGSLSIVSSILIVRTLGVEVIGKIAYYYGLVGMLTIFSDLGTEVAYKKFLSADKPHKQDIAGYIFLKLSLLILFCLIACIAYILFYQYPSIDKALIFIAFSITLIELSSQFFSNTLSGCRDFVYLSKIEVSASILLFIYNVIICLLFPNIYLLALNMGILP